MIDAECQILASAYILGASPDQLTKIYEVESAELEPWHDSPSEISKEDWRDFLGKRKSVTYYMSLPFFLYIWRKLDSDNTAATSGPSLTSSRTNWSLLDTTGRSFWKISFTKAKNLW